MGMSSSGNLKISLTWTAATYNDGYSVAQASHVKEYRVYRGVATGVYAGYFRIFTNALVDTGTLTMITDDITPPTTNDITAPQINVIRKSEVQSVTSYYKATYTNQMNDVIPVQSKIMIKMNDSYIWTIDLANVLNQSTWNTNLSQAENAVALSDIISWL